MTAAVRRVHFLVVGRVQGVGFRAHTQAAAQARGLVGFVRNRRDGAVEGEAEGPAVSIAEFAAWLHEGSPWSRVERVELQDLPVDGSEQDFAVRR